MACERFINTLEKMYLSKKFFHQGLCPSVVQNPQFWWMADVSSMEDQGHGSGFVYPVHWKTFFSLSLYKNKPCSRLRTPFKLPSLLQLQKEGWRNATYPSVCWRVCLIVLICWKCPDISVDKTISTTRLRRSLRASKVITVASILYWGTWIVLHWLICFSEAKQH